MRGLFSVAFCTDIKYFSLSSNSLFWEKEQSTAHSQTRGEKSPSQQKQSEDNQTCSKNLFVKQTKQIHAETSVCIFAVKFGLESTCSHCCCELVLMYLLKTPFVVKRGRSLSCLVACVYKAERSLEINRQLLCHNYVQICKCKL